MVESDERFCEKVLAEAIKDLLKFNVTIEDDTPIMETWIRMYRDSPTFRTTMDRTKKRINKRIKIDRRRRKDNALVLKLKNFHKKKRTKKLPVRTKIPILKRRRIET